MKENKWYTLYDYGLECVRVALFYVVCGGVVAW